MTAFTIGRAAQHSGVNVETIRYYERIGIVPAPPRTVGGQRRYGQEHLRRLAFVRRCRELGFSLGEVRALLQLVDGRAYSCDEVRDVALRHLDAVRRRIIDLQAMEKALDEMVSRCDGGSVPECPIIDALFAANG